MNAMKLTSLSLLMAALFLSGCSKNQKDAESAEEGPMEEAGEWTDDTAEDTGDAAEEAAEETSEALEEAAEDTEEAVDEATEDLDDEN